MIRVKIIAVVSLISSVSTELEMTTLLANAAKLDKLDERICSLVIP